MMFLVFCILTSLCIYLVNYYASKQVSWHLKLWSIVTWVLNFGLALIVPEDVFITLNHQNQTPEARYLGNQYLLLYWLVYLLTWTIIPVLQEWEDAGDLDSLDRLKRSLRINGVFYLVLIGIAILGLLAVVLLDLSRQMGLIIFLKCLATMWGMLLLMVLMGYSLVQIPKTMWNNANPENYLRYLYQKIKETEDELDDAKKQFKTIAAYIGFVRKNTGDSKILEYCDASEEIVPLHLKVLVKSNFQQVIRTTGYIDRYPIGLQSSIEHNRLMKRSIALNLRQEQQLKKYVIEAVFYEEVVQCLNSDKPLRSVVKTTGDFQSWWYCRGRQRVKKVGAIIFSCFSFLLLLSESQVFFSRDFSILRFILLFDDLQLIRILVLFLIAFIVYIANYALFRLKLANLYGLYPQQSDGPSLMFATVNFSRIGVAIVLNFFDIMKIKHSIYHSVMQTPQMGLLGEWVLKGLPGVLWLISICHFFNVWGRIAECLGVYDSYAFASHEVDRGGRLESPMLVLQKRKELQDRRSEGLLEEGDF